MKTKIERITLAQVSDVHLAPITGFGPRHWNIKRLLGYANWCLKRSGIHQRSVVDALVQDLLGQDIDHTIVSGDLVNLGLPSEIAAAKDWLGTLGKPNVVSAVPGNHDIYVGMRHDIGVARWADYMASDAAGARLVANASASTAMKTGNTPGRPVVPRGIGDDGGGAGEDGALEAQVPAFPFCRVVGPVAIIALNSAVPTSLFNATGMIGERQRKALAGTLNVANRLGLVRVVVIHHPPLPGQAPARRALRDARELEDVLKMHGAELVLHGHNHCESTRSFKGPFDVAPVVGAASASAGKVHGEEPLARYNVINIIRWNKNVRIDVAGRGMSKPGGRFHDISLRSFEVRMA